MGWFQRDILSQWLPKLALLGRFRASEITIDPRPADVVTQKEIRRSYVRYQNGMPQTGDLGHVRHCFDALRQDILCNADDTPRYSGFQPQDSTGLMQDHQCRTEIDWKHGPRRILAVGVTYMTKGLIFTLSSNSSFAHKTLLTPHGLRKSLVSSWVHGMVVYLPYHTLLFLPYMMIFVRPRIENQSFKSFKLICSKMNVTSSFLLRVCWITRAATLSTPPP